MNSVSVLQNIIMCLPQRHQRAVKCFLTEQKGAEDNISEIRLRHEGAFSLTIGNANVILNANGRTAAPGEKALTATPKELIETLDRLTEGSMHVFSQSLREGYLTLSNGCRVGVIGQAVCRGSTVERISSISALCIRIHHTIIGASYDLCQYIRNTDGALHGMLLFSPPGVGKTTALRDLAAQLARGKNALRVVIVDSRGELYNPEQMRDSLCDVLRSYPKPQGIEIAARTMSAQIIVCDEIGGTEDMNAILNVQNCGVPLIASAHAGSFAELMRRPFMQKLREHAVFDYYVSLLRSGARLQRVLFNAQGERLA